MTRPTDVALVFIIAIMLQIGPRGGTELRQMHWGQFSINSAVGGNFYTFDPKQQGRMKNATGGLKDCKKKRKIIEIFDNHNPVTQYNP